MEIKNSADLKAAILELEQRKVLEKQQLVDNFHEFTESLKPINLLKSTIVKVRESPGITGTVLKTAMGLGVGYMSRRLLIGKAPGIFRKIVGSALEMALAGLVAKKSDTITSTGARFFKNLFGSKRKETVF